VSTLRHVIEAMGGQLEIRAVFPDGDVRITQFQTLAEHQADGARRPHKVPRRSMALPHDPRGTGGRVVLPIADIDAMEARTWAQCLRRRTRRYPRARG
jgi:hypothetical protein